MSSNEVSVSGLRTLANYEVEVNGKPFNCMTCDTESCCRVEDDSYKNQFACYKCRCQAMYKPTSGSKKEKVVSGTGAAFECDSCDALVTKDKCLSMGYLGNALMQNVTVMDCSQNVITSGDGNVLDNVSMESSCANNNGGASGGGGGGSSNTKNTNSEGGDYPLGLTATQFKIAIVVIVILIIFLLIF